MSVLWISHRGYFKDVAENTRSSFMAAVDGGFTAFETDLRLTKDHHIVLIHDPDLKRLADLSVLVADLTRFELEELEYIRGGRPYFFDQFINDLAAYTWTFDIKPETGAQTIVALDHWVTKLGAREWISSQCKFVTWTAEQESLVRSRFPKAKFYAREWQCWRAGVFMLAGTPWFSGINSDKTYAIPPRIRGVQIFTPEIVQKFHDRGAKVLAFLPETPQDVELSLACNVDEILTNGLPEVQK